MVMSIYSYLFSMCLLKKSNFVFSYSQMLYYYSLKGFRLCIVDTRGRNEKKKKRIFLYDLKKQ